MVGSRRCFPVGSHVDCATLIVLVLVLVLGCSNSEDEDEHEHDRGLPNNGFASCHTASSG